MLSEQSTIDVVQEQINKAYRLGVNFERERCAKIARKHRDYDDYQLCWVAEQIEAAIMKGSKDAE